MKLVMSIVIIMLTIAGIMHFTRPDASIRPHYHPHTHEIK